MIVADASAVIETLIPDSRPNDVRERFREAQVVHAPHLLDVEVGSGLRRLVAGGRLSPDRATDLLDDALSMGIRRYPHVPLLERAWELRDNVSIYDGVYLALAEALDLPLVTCDARLARVPGHRARVETFPSR